MIILIILTMAVLMVSLVADRKKTLGGVTKGLRMFLGILPSLLNILAAVSVVLYLIPNETIVRLMGIHAGFAGMLLAAVLGSVAMIPGFVAFPLSAILLKSGIAYSVIGTFITTLMMVGIITLPLEAKYFGMKTALVRNGLSFIGALIIGLLIGLCI